MKITNKIGDAFEWLTGALGISLVIFIYGFYILLALGMLLTVYIFFVGLNEDSYFGFGVIMIVMALVQLYFYIKYKEARDSIRSIRKTLQIPKNQIAEQHIEEWRAKFYSMPYFEWTEKCNEIRDLYSYLSEKTRKANVDFDKGKITRLEKEKIDAECVLLDEKLKKLERELNEFEDDN
jgi:signal transduction histidine kinase